MTWYKNLGIIMLPIIVSFFYFPIVLSVFPVANTKMLLALLGCVVAGCQMAKKRFAVFDRQLLVISIWALSVSFITFASMTYNETTDSTYLTYIVSMYVWLMGAYAVVSFIRWVHGKYTLTLISNYLIVVCVLQCLLALVINQYKSVNIFVHEIMVQGYWIDSVHRLYGMGASLDTAGIRFSVAIVLLAYLLKNAYKNGLERYVPLYLAGFLILAIVGNMMARTTSVGVVIAILYLLYCSKNTPTLKTTWLWLAGLVLVAVPITIYFYHTNPAIHKNIRFAFEGFFNLFEKGEWSIASNEKLKTMYVYPETLKTWILGDGYIENPKYDPYYTGEIYSGFYKGTDVGYLRFIFYFGVTGLILFSTFILQVGKSCIQKFPQHKQLIVLLLMVNFIVWFKVSTDIFLIFALLLFMDEESEESPLLT